MKKFSFHYFSIKWMVVYGYLLIIIITAPYLPLLIRWFSFRGKLGSISGFVFGVEIFLMATLCLLAGGIFVFNRQRFPCFILIIGTLLTFTIIFYLLVPNPYELTHLPEYAILSILILQAINGYEGIKKKKDNTNYFYPIGKIGFSDKIWHKGASWFWNRFRGLPKISNKDYIRSAAFTTTLGVMDELYQGSLPSRYFNWYDIVLNMIGGLLGLTIVWGITREY